MAKQSAKGADSVPEFVAGLEKRIHGVRIELGKHLILTDSRRGHGVGLRLGWGFFSAQQHIERRLH